MDRKAARREYEERKPPMGVFRIRCEATGHSLVAAATDVNSRLNRHRAQLRTGSHQSRTLQDDWRLHGGDSFTFEVLELLAPLDEPGYDPLADLTVLEDLWLEKLGLSADRLNTIDPRRLSR